MKAREHLLDCVKSEGGRLGDSKALEMLSARLEQPISKGEYEEIKEQLISLGLVEKGRGKGGSIQIPEQIQNAPGQADERNQAKVMKQLLLSIRRTPGALAKMNKSSITCLLSSSKDKLYAGFDRESGRYMLTYNVEKGRPDHTSNVVEILAEASKDITCAQLTTGKHYTRIYLDDSLPRMNLLIRRLCDLLEEEDLENTLDDSRYWTIELGTDSKDSYFMDIASIISYATEKQLKWPFGSSFRKAFGFDAVDHLITVGRSYEAIRAKPSQHYREHVVPAIRIKEKALEMAKCHATIEQISSFLRSHLLIIIITKDEAALLDKQLTGEGISLKTSMPANWIWGDDPMERLECAGIKVELFKEYTPSLWRPWRPQKRQYLRHWLNKPLFNF